MRIYGIRHWIEQGYKQVKDEQWLSSASGMGPGWGVFAMSMEPPGRQ